MPDKFLLDDLGRALQCVNSHHGIVEILKRSPVQERLKFYRPRLVYQLAQSSPVLSAIWEEFLSSHADRAKDADDAIRIFMETFCDALENGTTTVFKLKSEGNSDLAFLAELFNVMHASHGYVEATCITRPH